MKSMFILLCFLVTIGSRSVHAQDNQRLRVMVLTDIEADPDDAQSMVRFLLYSNQWDIEGLIATTSIHQKKRVAPESIHKILQAYGKVQPNLSKHEKGFPTALQLQAKVKKGLPVYGMEAVGAGKESDGSNWIVAALNKSDNRPIWVSVWGGTNVLAQALWTIQHTKNADEAARLYKKLRVYTISDQDDSGPWIRKNFPGIFYIVSPGYNYTYASWLGMSFPFTGSDKEVVSNEWLAIISSRGMAHWVPPIPMWPMEWKVTHLHF